MARNYIVIGTIPVAKIININKYRSTSEQIPIASDLNVVVDIVWFTEHIDLHYPCITKAEAIDKVKRIIKNANHFFYGIKKKGVLYIEMNSTNKEILIVKYNKKQNNFRGDTAYQFSSLKLVQLVSSKDVFNISLREHFVH
jgi:hypothetical protein